jgi:hypothetical protein
LPNAQGAGKKRFICTENGHLELAWQLTFSTGNQFPGEKQLLPYSGV